MIALADGDVVQELFFPYREKPYKCDRCTSSGTVAR